MRCVFAQLATVETHPPWVVNPVAFVMVPNERLVVKLNVVDDPTTVPVNVHPPPLQVKVPLANVTPSTVMDHVLPDVVIVPVTPPMVLVPLTSPVLLLTVPLTGRVAFADAKPGAARLMTSRVTSRVCRTVNHLNVTWVVDTVYPGIFVLAFRLIFSVHLHTLYWRIPPRFPPARAPEEPVLPFLRTPTPEWPHRRAISQAPLHPRLELLDGESFSWLRLKGEKIIRSILELILGQGVADHITAGGAKDGRF